MSTNPNIDTIHHPLRMRMLSVVSTSRPTPRLVRVRLAGDDLHGFRSLGPADHVKVFFPDEGQTIPDVPAIGPNGVVRDPDRTHPYRARDYTPKHRPFSDDGVLELDIVLHDCGVGSDWARQAKAGDTLGVAGPRGSHVLTTGVGALILYGDETALPAIHNWLHSAPPSISVFTFVEIADDDDRQELQTDADLHVTWVPRNGEPPGRSRSLMDAVHAAELPAGDTVFHWAAGETNVIQQIRRHLIDERDIATDVVETRGYWRLGAEDHQEPHND